MTALAGAAGSPLSDPTGAPEREPGDPDLVVGATGLLAEHNLVGVLAAADVHLALRIERLFSVHDERVLLAAAHCVRAVREGSVCVDLTSLADEVEDARPAPAGGGPPERLRWPDPSDWLAACSISPVAVSGSDAGVLPLRVFDGRLYLDQYWRMERLVADRIDRFRGRAAPLADPERAAAAIERLFPVTDPADDQRQRLAAACAATRTLTVMVGGPGTGKTTTLSRLLVVLHDQPGPPPRVALAAPSGKAAARMTEALAEQAVAQQGLMSADEREWLTSLEGSTIDRLLGWRRPGRTGRFLHDEQNPLPYDVVVVDEASMASLTLMARLVAALRPGARVVLVGDPDQLASVEAGAVLGDLVARRSRPLPAAQVADVDRALGRATSPQEQQDLAGGVVRLVRDHRMTFGVGLLAAAVRDGDPVQALRLLRAGGEVTFIETAQLDRVLPAVLAPVRDLVADAGAALVAAARAGDDVAALAALDRHRILCGPRSGPYGVRRWNDLARSWTTAVAGVGSTDGEWYPGRPVLVTSNDKELALWNGDSGVVSHDGRRPVAVFARGVHPVNRLAGLETAYALTVHRSQGSQLDAVTVVLPQPDSPLLTRELLYTAITRSRGRLVVVGSAESLERAVSRPVRRVSGLPTRGSAVPSSTD